ncbi:MAG: PPOX class F420-dependent oxidoreductase [Candidatus Heimdallarchaeota archaeon]|nr:PPOX class F420-dependent oxidoreductase [Candidatus Heimdallarchaeota archaeon]MCK4768978.1 PPOX class F420-dependent oxidoreductase [Candidatus Heimdallarchaeota archaeon]MCK5158379.1 PPOX class F420-dependent oxidoreductase [Candidatus Heimdallarchaeota archaeon]
MIPEEYEDLLINPNFAHVATVNPDGSPQVTPVWIDYDKNRNEVIVNTALGRKKSRNMKIGSYVALSIQDQEKSYRYIGIQGDVIEVTEEGARDHIDKLAMKYLGKSEYPFYSGETRLLVKIRPKYVHTMG